MVHIALFSMYMLKNVKILLDKAGIIVYNASRLVYRLLRHCVARNDGENKQYGK